MNPKVSIVTTIFNNSETLEEFIYRTDNTFSKSQIATYEIVLIDDGSEVTHLKRILSVISGRPDINFKRFSRNFGHHKALIAGIEQAKGEIVCLIDSDLEESPEDLISLIDKLENNSADLVFGYQSKRAGSFWEKFSGWTFYRIMHGLGINIPRNFMTMRVMSRQFANNFMMHKEYMVNLSTMMTETGFKQIAVPLSKRKLRKGDYNFKRKLAIVTNAITSHSTKPLSLIFQIGLYVFIISSILATSLVVNWLLTDSSVSGWTSLIISIWILGGLTLLSIGTIGLYLSSVFMESKNRPRFIYWDTYNE